MTRRLIRLSWLTIPLALIACEKSDTRMAASSAPFMAENSTTVATAAPMPSAPRLRAGGGAGAGIGGVSAAAPAAVAAETELPDAGAVAASPAAMIIRTGTASVEVTSIDTAVALVRQLAVRVGGYVANTSLQSGRDQQRTATIELKIPADRYPSAVAGLSPLGKVETVTETAEDVGEEFVDVEARVANAHRLEARIVDLLAHHTGKLEDVLEVEQQLARVREEIERYEGRMRFLRTRAAISTLTITVHERLLVVAREEGRSPITNAVRAAWRNFVAVIAAIIASLGVLIPLGAGIWLLWRLVTHLTPRRRPGDGPAIE